MVPEERGKILLDPELVWGGDGVRSERRSLVCRV